MIRVNIYKDKHKDITKFFIAGHAGFADKGFDIVCAAVSILAHTALISLNEVCEINENDLDYFIDDNEGVFKVSLPINLDIKRRKKANIVLKTMELGLKSIMENYPENITLKYREV